jgi:hypothetical protein
MMKIAFVVAAAVLTTVPLVTPAKAQGVKMAQVDMQTGRHRVLRSSGTSPNFLIALASLKSPVADRLCG